MKVFFVEQAKTLRSMYLPLYIRCPKSETQAGYRAGNTAITIAAFAQPPLPIFLHNQAERPCPVCGTDAAPLKQSNSNQNHYS